MTTTSSSPILRPPRRRRWLTLLLGLVIFIAGLAAGSGLTVLFAIRGLQYAIHHPEQGPARLASVLQRKLGLDDRQKSQVQAIATERQAALQGIRREFHPQVQHQFDLLREQVDGVLTDSQRTRWERLFDELRQRWTPPPPAAREAPNTQAPSSK